MASMILDCPHCGTKKSGYTVQSEFQVPGNAHRFVVAGTCNSCHEPVIATLGRVASTGPTSVVKPMAHVGDLLNAPTVFFVRGVFPKTELDVAPASIPDNVRRAFVQAAESRLAKHFDAACSMYRKAMEIGLKAFSPDIEAWKLEKRIDRLAAEHRITPELQAWAHELRLDGNEALHGESEASAEMADQMHEICGALLTYLYTLPAQVERAKNRRTRID